MQYIIYVMICYNVTDHTAKQSGCAHGAFAIVFYEIASLKCLRLSTHARRDECVHVSLCQFARICVCARVCFYTSHAYIHIQYATCLYTIYIYIYICHMLYAYDKFYISHAYIHHLLLHIHINCVREGSCVTSQVCPCVSIYIYIYIYIYI